MDNHILIHADSGSCDYYTPPHIIEAARYLLNWFDLDPASSPIANQTVKARQIYTAADDGLSKPWGGRIFMNHPFSRTNNPLWINKLVAEYESGAVNRSINICFAAVNAKWFAPLLNFPQFFFTGRVDYLLPDGTVAKGVTKDSVITYMPPHGDYATGVIELQTAFTMHGIAGKAK